MSFHTCLAQHCTPCFVFSIRCHTQGVVTSVWQGLAIAWGAVVWVGGMEGEEPLTCMPASTTWSSWPAPGHQGRTLCEPLLLAVALLLSSVEDVFEWYCNFICFLWLDFRTNNFAFKSSPCGIPSLFLFWREETQLSLIFSRVYPCMWIWFWLGLKSPAYFYRCTCLHWFDWCEDG